MKNSVISFASALAIGLGLAPAALAADMPLKAPPMIAPAPAWSWTGFYIGGNVGYTVEQNTFVTNFTQPAPVLNTPVAGANGGSGFSGGVQGGYNWQFDPRWVLGVEGDWQSVSMSNAFCRPTDTGAPCADTGRGFLNFNQESDWLASVRGRLGYVWNGVLAYGTAGAAWGKVDTMLNASCLAAGCGNSAAVNSTTANFGNTLTGYVAGAGIEGQVWGNWTARFEWLHYGLGGPTNAFTSTPAFGTYTVSWKQNHYNYDTVRFGLNYKIW
jgi:outer membrane immunogenic protein